MSTIEYAENFTVVNKPVPRYGMLQLAPGQSPSGYGKKISSDRMVRFPDHPRLYRVYVICYSNSGTAYIIKKGKPLYFHICDLN